MFFCFISLPLGNKILLHNNWWICLQNFTFEYLSVMCVSDYKKHLLAFSGTYSLNLLIQIYSHLSMPLFQSRFYCGSNQLCMFYMNKVPGTHRLEVYMFYYKILKSLCAGTSFPLGLDGSHFAVLNFMLTWHSGWALFYFTVSHSNVTAIGELNLERLVFKDLRICPLAFSHLYFITKN